MADGGVVPHSAVVSVARAMRNLEAEGLVIISVPTCPRQGARMLARLSRAPSKIPVA
jgi:tRNA C32,U32 (ribose-2'-O)-methylase TrmJ